MVGSSRGISRDSSPSIQSEKRGTVFHREFDSRGNKLVPTYHKLPDRPLPRDTRPVNILEQLVKARREREEAALRAENESSKHASDDDDEDKENVDTIGTVRKERVFEEDVTEEEKEIIKKRIALQQRKFAEYEERERQRRYKKIKALYGYLANAEIDEAFEDCGNDEDEVLVQFSILGYLEKIRKIIAVRNHKPAVTTVMDDQQRARYEEHLKKRREAPKPRVSAGMKKQIRMGGRLALDEALKQVEENKVDPAKAFEGWSEARIKAYSAIDKKPNTYYYRFNAPGEVQRKGAWTKEEQKLFHARLQEVGATGQWGIFSMAIPGRVGYQCSNYYRLLVETNQIQDPNYVLDAKGKAHYLFEKKGANGEISKEFRTHNKHNVGGSGGAGSGSEADSPAPKPVKAPKEPKEPKEHKEPKEPKEPKPPKEPRVPKPPRVPKTSVQASRSKRKRRGYASDDSSDISEFDCDDSGSYIAKSYGTTKRTRTRAAAAAAASGSGSGPDGEDMAMEGGDDQDDDDEDDLDALNPLAGFIDPITLDEVIKPAISKYGHVMGYDSWIRCLTQEGPMKNICPISKKPLSKRDVTILTFENIDEYR
ncbi:hypothetical protein BGZ73_007715 [Actinomortierella ambigua]|nr:hypothetical protein BGZ73_007715 [Actinomortierella ambigua]